MQTQAGELIGVPDFSRVDEKDPIKNNSAWIKHQMEEQRLRMVRRAGSIVFAYITITTFTILLMRFFVFLWVSGVFKF